LPASTLLPYTPLFRSGYDVRVNANLNRMLTTSFTGRDNYMRPLPELMGDAEAMKNFGDTVVLWDAHTRQPLQVFKVPGAPLEVRSEEHTSELQSRENL